MMKYILMAVALLIMINKCTQEPNVAYIDDAVVVEKYTANGISYCKYDYRWEFCNEEYL